MLGHHSFIGRFCISDKNLFLIRGVRSICAHVSWIDINSFSLLTRAVDFSDRPQPSVSISVMFSLVYFSRIHPTCTFRSFFLRKYAQSLSRGMFSLIYSSSRTCLGLSSSIRLMKSAFSRHPSHASSHPLRMFFKSFTFSFFKSTVLKSICFS